MTNNENINEFTKLVKYAHLKGYKIPDDYRLVYTDIYGIPKGVFTGCWEDGGISLSEMLFNYDSEKISFLDALCDNNKLPAHCLRLKLVNLETHQRYDYLIKHFNHLLK